VDVSTTVGSSGNRLSAGKITPSDVSIQKDFDTASIPLLNLAFAGTSSNQPVIIGVTQTAKPANDTSKYLEYTLTNVIISSFSQGAGSSGTPTDSFTLNFTKCNLLAAPTGADNTPQQTVGGYDFALAQPC
jgi:type VI secretion system secreted protein Hcp